MKTYGDGWAAGTQCTQPQGLTPGGRAEVALRPPRRLGGGPRSAPGSRAELRRGWRPQGAGSVTPRPTEARLEHLRAYDNSRRAIRSLFLSLSLSLSFPLSPSLPPSRTHSRARRHARFLTRSLSRSFFFSFSRSLPLSLVVPVVSLRIAPRSFSISSLSVPLALLSVSLSFQSLAVALGRAGLDGVEGRGAGRGGKFLGNRGNRGVF